jgi:hypothetical protein
VLQLSRSSHFLKMQAFYQRADGNSISQSALGGSHEGSFRRTMLPMTSQSVVFGQQSASVPTCVNTTEPIDNCQDVA